MIIMLMGLLENYPIWVFNDIDKLNQGKIDEIDKNSEIPSTTLGLKLLCNNEKTIKMFLMVEYQLSTFKRI